MSKQIKRIAKKLGAVIAAKFPETGGGAFGAARLAALDQRLNGTRRTSAKDKRHQ
jgi:hypothetical protein